MTIYNAANAKELQAVLKLAKGGDTIFLQAGDYGKVVLSGHGFTSEVLVTAAQGANVHFDGLTIENSSNLSLRGLDLGRGLLAGELDITKLNVVKDSEKIKFNDVSIHGSLDLDPKNDGIGLLVDRVSGFELANSTVTEVYRGVVAQRSSDVLIHSNAFDEIRSDGINVAGVKGVLIDQNSFTNFRPSGPADHADAIQFWNSGLSYGSENITITNNIVMQGSGEGPQGIFISDDNGHKYKNISIKNNIIFSNDQYHGIYVNGAKNVAIVSNTTLSSSLDSKHLWIMVKNSGTVDIERNISDRLVIGTNVADLEKSENRTIWTDSSLAGSIQNLDSPIHVSDLIVNGSGYQGVNSGYLNQLLVAGTNVSRETLRGTPKSEVISAVPEVGGALGTGTLDTLFGGGGSDLFVLGDGRGLFFDDQSSSSSGRSDYAIIRDFGADDKIQLVGEFSDYILKHEKIGGVSGTSIFRDDNGNGSWDRRDEYIAHVSGSSSALALGNFVFVDVTGVSSFIAFP
jgi:hypothetical protein